MITYRSAVESMREQGHRSKCVVVALSILFDMDYDKALTVMNSACARRVSNKAGYYQREWYPVFESLAKSQGREFTLMSLAHVRRYAKTTKSFTPRVAAVLGIKNGLIKSRGHVSAIKNGVVEDWADDRKKRIEAVWVIDPLNVPEPKARRAAPAPRSTRKGSKMASALVIYKRGIANGLSRKEIIALFISEAGLTPGGAPTYYQLCRKKVKSS